MSDEQLKNNIEAQLNRLLSQLQDCEDMKSEMDADEYTSTKKETLEQLEEFRKSLGKMQSGNMTLVDQINRVQIAIRAAVSQAFQTPEVIRLFAKKAPGQLRERIAELQRDHQLGKIDKTAFNQGYAEVLSALQQLGQELSADEKAFLGQNMTAAMREFSTVTETSGKEVLKTAADHIQRAQH
eukprot:comp15931_c0_seq1/m.24872 comp15931_c0_seq1/g.24872  ORF comp15931_c0_seq1/g.24872 comp15931_c0_seq1/m.24872 type:complete len:183 (+) comp15931_c0_seq1:37-585(+)